MNKTWVSEHNNESVMNKLFDLAKTQKTLFKTSRHAAGIVYKGKLLVTGVNKAKTHPIMKEFNYTHSAKIFIHAEIDAIIKTVNKYGVEIIPHCDLYSLRITNTDKIANSKPCQGCMDAIKAFKFKNVYWSE